MRFICAKWLRLWLAFNIVAVNLLVKNKKNQGEDYWGFIWITDNVVGNLLLSIYLLGIPAVGDAYVQLLITLSFSVVTLYSI